jgi:hypothetical protein
VTPKGQEAFAGRGLIVLIQLEDYTCSTLIAFISTFYISILSFYTIMFHICFIIYF